MQDNRADKLLRMRHSFSHVMAEAVLQVFPTAKLAIGPAIDDGFYYDFDLPRALTTDDLSVLEEKIRLIVAGNHAFSRKVITRDEARRLFKDQPYKLELIEELPEGRGDLHLFPGHVYGPVPGPPRGEHEGARRGRLQAHLDRGSLLARRREEQDAAAHLRNSLGNQGRPGCVPREAPGNREAGSSAARERAGPVLGPRGGGSRPHLLAPQGRPGPPGHRGFLA